MEKIWLSLLGYCECGQATGFGVDGANVEAGELYHTPDPFVCLTCGKPLKRFSIKASIPKSVALKTEH